MADYRAENGLNGAVVIGGKPNEPSWVIARCRRMEDAEKIAVALNHSGAVEALERAHAALDKGHDHTAETWQDRERWTAAKLDAEGGSSERKWPTDEFPVGQ